MTHWNEAILNQAKTGENFLINARAGCGKAQPVSEPVLTPDGWRRMGDLRVGDYVFGSNGLPTQVLGVYPQTERKPIVSVTFNDRSTVRCTWDHLWTVEGTFGERFTVDTGYLDRFKSKLMIPALSRPIQIGVWVEAAYSKGFRKETKKLAWLCPDSRKAFLRGILDADNSSDTVFYSEDEELCGFVRDLIRSLGGFAYEPRYCNDRVLSVRFDSLNSPSRAYQVTEIKELSYEEPSVCIKVDAPDSLYVTANFKLTHNTTMLSQINAALPDKAMTCIAFNKHNAEDLQRRTSAKASTIHSLGMSLLRDHYGRLAVNQDKSAALHKTLRLPGRVIDFQQAWELFRLLGGSSVNEDVWEQVDDMVETDVAMYTPFTEQLVLADLALVEQGQIDYTDMVWSIPYLLPKALLSDVDILCLDEAQDASGAAIALLAHILPAKTQFIAVGDDLQAIFNWCGALDNTFPMLQNLFDTPMPLKLPVTYRCPDTVAAVARRYCPDLEHIKEGGTVLRLSDMPPDLMPQSLVIARTYGELIPEFFHRKMDGENVMLKGSNFVEATCKAVLSAKKSPRCRNKSYFEVLDLVKGDREQRLSKLPMTLGAQDRRRTLLAEVDALNAFSSYFDDYEEMYAFASNISKHRPGAVTFSSIHRCKGNENANVYFLGHIEQHEAACSGDFEALKTTYVGCTRSSDTLYLVH